MDFSKDNKGSITFLANGRVSGEMYWECFGSFEWAGKRAGDLKRETEEVIVQWGFEEDGVAKWKREYYRITRSAWDREGSSRWGGWGGENRERREKNSDTEEEPGSEDEDDAGERSESGDEESGFEVSFSFVLEGVISKSLFQF